ncbi:MAG TPA: hypothetical protein VHT27_14440 [Solirubrobacteraceae bacterium]|jgi:hypothetical protein|nr:hypothetical protein [Solirubrobacteraceae bacterium]
MRRVALALAGLVLAAPAVAAPGARSNAYEPAEWPAQLAGDRALGEQAAHELLARLNLPPGSAPSEPASGSEEAPGSSTARASFTSPGTAEQVVEYILAHPPTGALAPPFPPRPEANPFAEISFPPLPGEVAAERMTIQAQQLPAGRAAFVARADVAWLVPRERIPGGVRAVDVAVSVLGPPRIRGTHRYVITRPSRVAQLVRIVEAMPVDRPSFAVLRCPLERSSVSLGFITAAGAPPVAEAILPTGPCGRRSLTVEGNVQPALSDTHKPYLQATLEHDLNITIPL